MDDIKRAELLTACLVLREYLEPYVCECYCAECDDCSFCERDMVYNLKELEKIIRNDKE